MEGRNTLSLSETGAEVRPESTLPRSSSGGIAVVDYLRGIAALGVALFHVRVPLWVGWREIAAHPERYSELDRAVAWLSTPTPFMGSFVMLFFVISGFCVHLPQAGKATPLELRRYLWRRFFRIYPPYVAAVLLSAAVLLVPGVRTEASATDWRHVLASMGMVQNYVMGGGGEGVQLATNPALWSLPVEMELYLVYPLLLIGTRRLGWAAMLAVVTGVSLAATAAGAAGAGWVTGNFAMYWIIWSTGAWLAEQWARGDLRAPPWWCGVAAAIAFAVGLRATFGLFPAEWASLCYGVFYAWGIWLLLSRQARWNRLPLALAAGLSWLGRVSYSFYLIHFPVFILLGAGWMLRFETKPANFLVALLAVIFSGVFVAAFYRVVERPSHGLARRAPTLGTAMQG